MDKIKRHRTIICAVMLLAIASISQAVSKTPRSDWDDAATKRKAEYIYLESQNAYGLEQYEDFAIMMRRAYDLDSSDVDIAAEWGLIVLADQRSDSAATDQAYRALKRRFFTDTSDYLTGMVLANMAKRTGHYADLERVWEALYNAFPTMTQPGEELAQSYLISYIMGDSAAYDKAMGIYQRLESGQGKNINLSAQKIRAYSIKADTAAIIDEVESLASFAPQDSYVALFAGSNYEYLNDDDKALDYYTRACQLDSTNGNAFMSKANLYSQMGDSAAFDREVFLALRSQNLEMEPKLEMLRSYVSKLYTDPTQERRIRELFGELEQMHAGEAEVHNLYAAYLYEIGDYRAAAEEMGYSVSLDPTNEGSWASLVQTLSLANDTLAAINSAVIAMDKFPTNLYFPIIGADGYRQLGDVHKALEIMDSVEVKKIVNAEAVSNFYAFKGDLQAMAGDTLTALKTYDEAININPDNNMALNNAAYFMAENGIDLPKAERYSAMAVRNEPENATYLDTYAWVFFKKKEYTLARQYIDMTINLYNSAPADDNGQEDVEIEVEADGNIVEKVPSADIYEHAGDIYFMDGDPAAALQFWQKALQLDPNNELLARKVKHKTYFYK